MLGARRHLVTIEAKSAERSDVDSTPEDWEEYCRCWCDIQTPAAGEAVESGQLVSEALLTLVTHWTPITAGITAAMRASLVDGTRLAIRSAVNTGLANRELVLSCVARAANEP